MIALEKRRGKEMLKKIFQKAATVSEDVTKAHVGAYAAQSAYFSCFCMIPIILLLLTLVQYTPVTKADVMTAVMQVFPSSVDSLMISIVNQVYNQSMGIIPVTIIVALWSAGKGVLAMTSGLNCIYEMSGDKKLYFPPDPLYYLYSAFYYCNSAASGCVGFR